MKKSFTCGSINGGDCSYKVKAANNYVCILAHEPTKDGELANGSYCDPIFWAKITHDQESLTSSDLAFIATGGLTNDLIKVFARSNNPTAHIFLASNLPSRYSKTFAYLIRAKNEGATMRLAGRVDLSEQEYLALAQCEENTAAVLARNSSISVEVMSTLAYNSSDKVKANLATNPSLIKPIAKILSNHGVPSVNVNLLMNGSVSFTDQEIEKMLVEKETRAALAKTATSAQVIDALLKVEDSDLTGDLASNKHLQTHHFMAIYGQAANNREIAKSLLENRATPFEIVDKVLAFYSFAEDLCFIAIANGKSKKALAHLFATNEVSSATWETFIILSTQFAALEKNGAIPGSLFNKDSYDYLWGALSYFEQCCPKSFRVDRARENLTSVIG